MSDEGQTIYVDYNGKVLKSAAEAVNGAVQLTGKDAEDYLKTGKSSYVPASPGADAKKADADKAEADKAAKAEAEKAEAHRTTQAKAASAPANKARHAASNK